MLLGHQKQWDFLIKSAELKRLPHALLFSGPEQIGKKTLAIEFVKYLNCQPENCSERPCQKCRNCQDIQKKAYPDFLFLGSESSGKEIQISQIRGLIEKLSFRPYSSFFKTAIIDNVHLMTQEAQNCFLKFLEEPRGNALLFLVTEYPERLLATILSRIQKLKFLPPSLKEMEDYLLSQHSSKEKIKEILHFSSGKPGRIFDFIADPRKLEERKKIISDLIKISESDLAFRFQYVKNLAEENIKEILDIWLGHFRSLLLSPDNQSLAKTKNIIENIQSTIFLLSSTNVNSRLILELLLMKL